MTKFELIKKSIKSFHVYWSESTLVNKELRCDNNGDIEQDVSFDDFVELCNRAIKEVDCGYDKTKVRIDFHDGDTLTGRFYLGDYPTIEEHIEESI